LFKKCLKQFKEFGLTTTASSKPFGSGLINNTWLIRDKGNDFILQRINHNVFKKSGDIATNIGLIADHLKRNYGEYLFVTPNKTISGEDMI